MKRKLSLLLAMVMALSLAAGVIPTAFAAAYAPGEYSAKAQGFGGTITVTITVNETRITACKVSAPKETSGIGGAAAPKLAAAIAKRGSANVDVISGATVTSNAVLRAARAALKKAAAAPEAQEPEKPVIQMKAGEYEGSGRGYDWIEPVTVKVAVDESKILSIEVTDAGRETPPIFRSAEERIIPRMIDSQSVAVDAITGATASSNGIRSAVVEALEKALAAGGAAEGAIELFQTEPVKKGGNETIDVDVLVVGMGGSGCATAMSAAEAMYKADPDAVSVLAIDKSAKFGGTSANCGEPMGVNAPRYKEAFNGGEDYMDGGAMRAAWLEYTGGDEKTELVDLFLENSGETIDWLFFDHGFLLNNPLKGFTAQDVYRCKYQYVYAGNAEEGRDYGRELVYRPDQVDSYFQGMMEDYTGLGGEYMLETEAYELLYDRETNTVTGVKAVGADGAQYQINAKAVVLATGGFAGNGEMQKEYLSDEYWPLKGVWGTYGYGMTQNDGKMIQSAIDIGAGTYNIDMPPMVHFVTTTQILTEYPVNMIEGKVDNRYGYEATWSLNDVPMTMAISQNVLQVDVHGDRYANEAETFVWWKAGPTFFSIWSDAQVKEVQKNGFSVVKTTMAQGQGGVPVGQPIPEIYDVLESAVKVGYVYKADTLKELAAKTGMDPAKLEKSVAAYNEMCSKGEDTQYGKDPKYLWALGSEGPYYAVNGASVTYSTCGALDVDTKLRVLQSDGKTAIGGLYAVGNDSMGVLYTNKKPYVTFGGAALGWAFTSGRLAGGFVTDFVLGRTDAAGTESPVTEAPAQPVLPAPQKDADGVTKVKAIG